MSYLPIKPAPLHHLYRNDVEEAVRYPDRQLAGRDINSLQYRANFEYGLARMKSSTNPYNPSISL
jgi:hypothetical protein